jgi:murein L,D-transpeptidase YcbB/YkuD
LDSIALAGFIDQHPDYLPVAKRVSDFYAKRNYRFAWMDNEGPNDRSFSLVNLFSNALEEGIVLRSLDLSVIQSLFDELPADTLQGYGADERTIRFELELTANYFLMADASAVGLPVEKRRSLEWYIPSGTQSPDVLADALSDTLSEDLLLPHPEDSLYHQLQLVLKQYRGLAKSQDWSPLGLPSESVRKGERFDGLSEIKRRLWLLGDLSDSAFTDEYDDALDEAVIRFRQRHALRAEHIIDSVFISCINVTPEERVRQVLVNMERCRWLPRLPQGEFILVNIPEYRLRYYSENREEWSCPVIVGKSTTRTTIISGRLNEVVFSPYWNVPKSILVKELLPEIKADPRKLSAYHLEVRTRGKQARTIPGGSIDWKRCVPEEFPYELRQTPGPWNSLGRVKFLFPNNFGIYLHDTPSKGLFAQEQRMFSHGCVRVADPVRLAKEVLDDKYWTAGRIHEAMATGKEMSVPLKHRIQLLVVYFTCWVDASGLVHFVPDGYGHDARLAEELFVGDSSAD